MSRLSSKEIIRAFGGGTVIAEHRPLFCLHCDTEWADEFGYLKQTHAPVKDLATVLRQRRGLIVKVTWPNGRCYWACHCCGREIK